MYTYGRKQRIEIRCLYKGAQLLSISNNNFFQFIFNVLYCKNKRFYILLYFIEKYKLITNGIE